jgi:hypothetical protein
MHIIKTLREVRESDEGEVTTTYLVITFGFSVQADFCLSFRPRCTDIESNWFQSKFIVTYSVAVARETTAMRAEQQNSAAGPSHTHSASTA